MNKDGVVGNVVAACSESDLLFHALIESCSLQSGPRCLILEGCQSQVAHTRKIYTYCLPIFRAVDLNFCTSGWLYSSQRSVSSGHATTIASPLLVRTGFSTYLWQAKIPHILATGSRVCSSSNGWCLVVWRGV